MLMYLSRSLTLVFVAALVAAAMWWILGGEQELTSSVYALYSECVWIESVGVCDVWIVVGLWHWARIWSVFVWTTWFAWVFFAIAIAWAALRIFVAWFHLVHHWVEVEWVWRESSSLMRDKDLLILWMLRMWANCAWSFQWLHRCLWQPLVGVFECWTLMVMTGQSHLLIAHVCAQLFNRLGAFMMYHDTALVWLAFLLILIVILWWWLIAKLKEASQVAWSLLWADAAFQALRWSDESFYLTGGAEKIWSLHAHLCDRHLDVGFHIGTGNSTFYVGIVCSCDSSNGECIDVEATVANLHAWRFLSISMPLGLNWVLNALGWHCWLIEDRSTNFAWLCR